MSLQSCKSCSYYHKERCHRFPPTYSFNDWRFPYMHPDDPGCGEHKNDNKKDYIPDVHVQRDPGQAGKHTYELTNILLARAQANTLDWVDEMIGKYPFSSDFQQRLRQERARLQTIVNTASSHHKAFHK